MSLGVDVAGWLGAIMLLVAYGCVSFKKVSPASITYHLLNAAGSALFVINTLFHKAYAPAFLNCVWGLIALTSLLLRAGKHANVAS